MTETKSIPQELKDFINKYLNLQIKGEKVIAPYFINTSGFLKQPIFAGKGDPYDIESKANEMFASHDFKDDKARLVRQEMEKIGLGVDCSGLVYQAYNKWLRDILGKGDLKSFLPKENPLKVRKFFSRVLKPEASVSADMFTSGPISESIEVKDIRPGDLIRTRGGKHLLLITDVTYRDGIPFILTFVNSTTFYTRNGVRYGEITLNKDLNLANAEWRDLSELNGDTDNGNFAYKGYRELMNNNGVWRPKFL
jgi:hypothetical protein